MILLVVKFYPNAMSTNLHTFTMSHSLFCRWASNSWCHQYGLTMSPWLWASHDGCSQHVVCAAESIPVPKWTPCTWLSPMPQKMEQSTRLASPLYRCCWGMASNNHSQSFGFLFYCFKS